MEQPLDTTTMLAAEDDDATVLADDLSVCDEEGAHQNRQRMTSAQIDAQRSADRQRHFFALFLLCTAFIVSVVVATVRYYAAPRTASQESGGGELWGSQQREKENELRLQQTLEYLTKFAVSSPSTLAPETNFEVVGGRLTYTPQYQAAYWIAAVDQRRISIPTTSAPSRQEYPFKQRYSIAVLFFATGGLDYWIWRMNFLTGVHECEWFDDFTIEGMQGSVVYWGVECDGAPDMQEGEESPTRAVTGISLPPFNEMYGTLPPELHHLKYLKMLHILFNDGIQGTIPYQYSSLRHLNDLALMHTSLTGKIPREFARLEKLEYLYLNDNRLALDTVEGDLDFVKDLTSLVDLHLEYNADIVGTLPDAVSDMMNLRVLALYNTGLYGTIPPSLSKLTKLRGLQLGSCDFEGSVEVINGMPSLTHVYLENNRFDDTMDEAFFGGLDQLVHLDISNCSFSGMLPGHLFSFPELKVLDMHNNSISGKLHAEALADAEESQLEFLSLHSNKLTGPIPSSISSLKNLTVLDLSLNEFDGDIPTAIGDLTQLDVLFLGRNNFNEAPVPEWLQKLKAMTELSLKSSSLNGTIPEWLGDMTNLKFLDLGENGLDSTIPQSLGNLTNLMVLILNANRLRGEVGLGDLWQLETLLIDDNALTGDTGDMCQHELVHFIADCARGPNGSNAELNCTCCTLCCRDENVTCNDSEWLGNHGGLAEFGYDRLAWEFEEGFVSPLLNYNFMQLFN
ncbi:hypothetical protein ACHAXT_000196 [Thalassiosira profunda]